MRTARSPRTQAIVSVRRRVIELQTRYKLFAEFWEHISDPEKEELRLEDGLLLRDIGKDQKAQTNDDVVLELYYPVQH